MLKKARNAKILRYALFANYGVLFCVPFFTHISVSSLGL